ncbi:hypothetical protein QFC19_000149 [Naganishia cerealis]|uniref:Uncharacterized protein n=1 Tax=Naganishia cerealis TaxID=610337 RepID=A0ACC2WR47_9TREE|nr:hypothetical protein QFC19_000149 [Naganishia cerealis]
MADSEQDPSTDIIAMEQSLTSLMTYLELLQNEPSNIPLIEEVISLARKCGMSEQVETGLEMLVGLKGCDEATWLEVLENVRKGLPKLTSEDHVRIQAVLDLLRKAIQDYLSIPVLLAASRIAIALHPSPALPSAEDADEVPQSTDSVGNALVSEEDARSILLSAAKSAGNDISFSDEVWRTYLDWEVALFAALPEEERSGRLANIQKAYLDRLAMPHSSISETSQAYSTFNSTYAPNSYEENMVKASKIAAKSAARWEAREAWETGWVALCTQGSTNTNLDSHEAASNGSEQQESLRNQKIAYLYSYLEMELSTAQYRKPEPKMVECVFERWLAVCSSNKTREGRVAEASVWDRYITYVATTNGFSKAQVTQTMQRAVRCCPHSGELWARLLRNYEILKQDLQIIGETYMRALSLGVLTRKGASNVEKPKEKAKGKDKKKGKGKGKAEAAEEESNTDGAGRPVLGDPKGADVVELAALEAAWTGFMRRMEEANADRGMSLLEWSTLLRLKLEGKGKVVEGINVWDDLVKLHGRSYQAWSGYTDYLIRHNEFAKARSQFKVAVSRNLDWPESIWTAWIAFEDYHGTPESLNAAKLRVGPLQEALAAQRAQALMANQHASVTTGIAVGAASPSINVDSTAIVPSVSATEQAMEVDATEDSRKRKADEVAPAEDGSITKRQRVETDKVAAPARDREYATVLVSGLSSGVTEADIRKFFRECGQVRDVTLSQQNENMLAAVEFMNRDSVPAALTRDKKRIGEDEVHVYQAGHTTLFVTNFPEKMDDASLREMFAPYGDIVETRWPSKKFKDSRRFCYVQFTTTGAAAAASEELNGKELESGFPVSVLISDPDRKKQRSDANADARELYVSQLSKFMNEQDMDRVFSPFGSIKRISLAKDEEGKCKGFGFVEFETEEQARAALSLDGHEYKKRTMNVRLSEQKSRRDRRAGEPSSKAVAAAVNRSSDILDRSIRLYGLPPKTQEGLLQQALEKIVPVKKVEVFQDVGQASVELANAADVGALLLKNEPFVFADSTITFAQETDITRNSTVGGRNAAVNQAAKRVVRETTKPSAMFQPRPPKAGIGARKKANFTSASVTRKHAATSTDVSVNAESSGAAAQTTAGAASSSGPKGQDDFRKMLLEGKK